MQDAYEVQDAQNTSYMQDTYKVQDANENQNQDYYEDEYDGTMYNEDDDYGQH
jgi:hypothetical protein